MFQKTLLVLALLAVVAVPVQADTLLTLKSHQDAFEFQGQSQEAQDGTVEMWIGETAISRDDDTSRVVVTADKLYLIDHASKTYSVLDLPVDLASLLPEGMAAQLDQMRGQMTLEADVEATDETKEVGEWTARRYDVTLSNKAGLTVDQVIWASEEVGVDAASYNRLTGTLAELQPGGAGWVSELAAMKGFPVLRETTMHLGPEVAVTTIEELVSVERKDAPAGTFAPPDGYAEKDFNPGAAPGQS